MTRDPENQTPTPRRPTRPLERNTNPIGDEHWIRHAYNRGSASVAFKPDTDTSHDQYNSGIAELEACDELRTDKLHADLRQLCTEVPSEHLADAILALLAAERRLER